MLILGNFRVNWRHHNPQLQRVIVDDSGRKYIRHIGSKEFFGTKCFIYALDKADGEVKSVGVAKLHKYKSNDIDVPKGGYGFDVYEKEMGRSLSLNDALSNLDLSDEELDNIWDDYNFRT